MEKLKAQKIAPYLNENHCEIYFKRYKLTCKDSIV